MVVREKIARHSFVCEYRSRIVQREEREKGEFLHDYNKMGCYMVDVAHPVSEHGKITFDATEHFHNPGRYINHAKNGNIRPWPLMHVRVKLRMGFLSLRDIETGEELALDYGVRDKKIPFLSNGRLEEGRVVGEVAGRDVVTVKVSEGTSERAAISFSRETITYFNSWLGIRSIIVHMCSLP